MEKGVKLDGVEGTRYLYHDPCHTPMKTYAPLAVAEDLLGAEVRLSDRCCGEAGTLAVSRPDIATQIRFLKQRELQQGLRELIGTDTAAGHDVKLLTSCPACQQGLSRYQDDTGLETEYIVVELCNSLLGDDWQQDFVDLVNSNGIGRAML